jgi:hypothetical protein
MAVRLYGNRFTASECVESIARTVGVREARRKRSRRVCSSLEICSSNAHCISFGCAVRHVHICTTWERRKRNLAATRDLASERTDAPHPKPLDVGATMSPFGGMFVACVDALHSGLTCMQRCLSESMRRTLCKAEASPDRGRRAARSSKLFQTHRRGVMQSRGVSSKAPPHAARQAWDLRVEPGTPPPSV